MGLNRRGTAVLTYSPRSNLSSAYFSTCSARHSSIEKFATLILALTDAILSSISARWVELNLLGLRSCLGMRTSLEKVSFTGNACYATSA